MSQEKTAKPLVVTIVAMLFGYAVIPFLGYLANSMVFVMIISVLIASAVITKQLQGVEIRIMQNDISMSLAVICIMIICMIIGRCYHYEAISRKAPEDFSIDGVEFEISKTRNFTIIVPESILKEEIFKDIINLKSGK